MTKTYICHTPYLTKHTSFDCVFCCTSLKWWHLQMLFSFFQNFSFLGCWGKCSHCISQELYIIWLWFLVHMCKMMISPAIFFLFFKILVFRVFQSLSINAIRKFWGVPTVFTCVWFFSKWRAVVTSFSSDIHSKVQILFKEINKLYLLNNTIDDEKEIYLKSKYMS